MVRCVYGVEWDSTIAFPLFLNHTHTHCELRWSLRSVISASQVSCCCRCLVVEESEESLVSLLNSHESQGVTGSSWGHGPSAYRKDTFYGRILKSPVETSVRLVGDEVYEFQDCDDADFTRRAFKALKTCKQVVRSDCSPILSFSTVFTLMMFLICMIFFCGRWKENL